ncbi:MAG: hypothetical protein V4592_00225 [Bacteroidota bacterium]
MVLITAGGYYAYQKYLGGDKWKPLLQAQLKELVAKSSDSLYHIEYSDFDLNIASGNATLTDFKLVPDTAVYQKLLALKKAPDNLFTLSVKKLTIKNVGARKAYQEKILNIDNITIDKPSLTIVNHRLPFNDTVKVGTPQTPYQIIKKVFKQLRIDSIALKDISLNYINKSNALTKQTAIRHLDISITNIQIDSLSSQDPNRFYYTKGVEFILHDYRMATADSLYYLKVKQLSFNTALRNMVLDEAALTPRYSKKAFFKKIGRSDDRFDLSFKKIAISDIDLQRFLRDQKLYAGLLDISNGKVEIYADNSYKGKKTSKIGKDPHQQLQKVALDMKLKRLNLHNTSITYAEADATSGYTGIINFENTTGTFYNVTNDADAKKLNPFMIARIRTRFLGAAPLAVNFKFNLNAKDGAFNYSGTLGKFDGRVLDKLVRPLALIHVKSADIDQLNFNVNASNYGGKGHLEFYYHKLNVELLKKDTGKVGLVKQGLISKIANTLIIEDDNPDKKGNFRPGPIELKREPTVSFFSFLYKALLDGLKPSVGFDKKTEGKVNTAVAKISNIVDKFNQFKENRKKRREEKKKAKEIKKLQDEQNKKEKSPD